MYDCELVDLNFSSTASIKIHIKELYLDIINNNYHNNSPIPTLLQYFCSFPFCMIFTSLIHLLQDPLFHVLHIFLALGSWHSIFYTVEAQFYEGPRDCYDKQACFNKGAHCIAFFFSSGKEHYSLN